MAVDEQLEAFISRVPDFTQLSLSSQVDYLVYYLVEIQHADGVSPSQVRSCFDTLRIPPHSNVPHHLSKHLKKTSTAPAKFVRVKGRYYLNREFSAKLAATLKGSHLVVAVKSDLRSLEKKITDVSQAAFLAEAISCFEVKAYRATVIMVWNLAIHHLYDYVLRHGLTKFNAALALNKDKRVKVGCISSKDDFADIPENKFIEFCRTAKLISNDVRKILDTKLGVRNTCAHPSNVTVSESKAVDAVEDLVQNVVLKYPL